MVAQQTSKGVHVSVNVQYKPLPTATVKSVMHVFESPYWANFMIQYIVPYLKSYKPTSHTIMEKLAEWTTTTIDDQDACAICMSSMDNQAVRLPCGHAFHNDCVRQWLTRCNTCPNCRHEFQKELSGRFVVSTIKTSLLVEEDIHNERVKDVLVGGRTMQAVVNMTLFQVHDQANYGCDLFVELQQAPPSEVPQPSSTRSSRKRSATKIEAARILKRLRAEP